MIRIIKTIRIIRNFQMQAKKLFFYILPILLSSIFLSGCTLPFIGGRKQAALQVTATPQAAVFLDGEHLGSTPYFDEKLKPGDYTLKLVPEGENNLPWEAKIKLVSGILTVVSRELGESIDSSSGYVLSLEEVPGKKNTSLVVVSEPDGAVVKVDGEPKGFAPIAVENISTGEHLLVVSSPGYVEKNIKAKTIEGYKLTATVQLAKEPEVETEEKEEDEEATESAELEEEIEEETKEEPEEEETASPSAYLEDELPKPYVKIKNTPTGWLNVRSEPSTAKKEESILTKVDPGEVFPFVESTANGWYRIEYKDGEEGWIAGQYAELYK